MMSMESPERLFLDSESQVYRVAGRKLKDSNIEYIRADLARAEAVKWLVEAAKEAMTVMDEMLDYNFSCFSDCAQWEKCSENGTGCLILARLEAAIAAVEG